MASFCFYSNLRVKLFSGQTIILKTFNNSSWTKIFNVDSLSSSCLLPITRAMHSSNSTSTHKSSVDPYHSNTKSQDDVTIQHAQDIFNQAVTSVLPHEMIKRHLHFDINSNTLTVGGCSHYLNHNVHIVGFGKAVLGMVRAVEDFIGPHIVQGIVSVPVGAKKALTESGKLDMIPLPDSKVNIYEGAPNNLPDLNALKAALKIKNIAESVGKDDILLVLISGGGSALLPTPQESVDLTTLMQVSREMGKAGANIKQLNYMRKQLEVLKGGGLATLANPAKVVTLILSDVIGDPLDFIASGPTVPDTSTPRGCLSLFSELGIDHIIPESVMTFLRQMDESIGQQSPENQMDWTRVQNVIIGYNALACANAAEMSKSLGYLPYVIGSELDGEARNVGSSFASLALYISLLYNSSYSKTDVNDVKHRLIDTGSLTTQQFERLASLVTQCKEEKKSIAIIAGGETTVNVKGSGLGGRNQEMAVAAAIEFNALFSECVKDTLKQDSSPQSKGTGLRDNLSIVFLAGGTDGQDGPTPAAGGVVTLDFVKHVDHLGLNAQKYLDENDSYTLLKAVDEHHYLLETGLTGTNVMDISLLLIRVMHKSVCS